MFKFNVNSQRYRRDTARDITPDPLMLRDHIHECIVMVAELWKRVDPDRVRTEGQLDSRQQRYQRVGWYRGSDGPAGRIDPRVGWYRRAVDSVQGLEK